MNLTFLFFIFYGINCFSATYSVNSTANNLISPNDIRVRIEKNLKHLEIQGRSLSVQGDSVFQKIAIPSSRQLRITRLSINGKFYWQVKDKDKTSDKTTVYYEKYLLLKGDGLHGAKGPVPNKLILSATKNRIDVIGVLPIEDYLVGVLASEMPLSWPMESLRAQSIAARSYALSLIKERQNNLFHVESDILDQVFKHVSQGVDHDPLVERAFEAVQSTKSQVLMNSHKKLVKTYYHADCGGKTVSAQSVWGRGDKKTFTVDKFCESSLKSKWNYKISENDLNEKITNHFKLPKELYKLAALEQVKEKNNSRTQEVIVKFTNGESNKIPADSFRALLGYQVLKSTLFEILNTEKQIYFSGKGFGHGVGMCQQGSRAMALQKKSYQEILAHYFPGTRIEDGSVLVR